MAASIEGSARTLRVVTRASRLALLQTHVVVDALVRHHGIHCDIVPITTKGDREHDRSLTAIGGDGVFVKELMNALSEGRADIAVHSLKDVPTEIAPALDAGAVLAREDARDVLVSAGNRWTSLDALPAAARVGTSSLRRAAQLRALRPDLTIVPLRGNVDTRIAKVTAGECDAEVLALAGLVRLQMLDAVGGGVPLALETMVPPAGQGALFAQCRADDRAARLLLQPLQDEPTRFATVLERRFLQRAGAGCVAPVGVHVSVGGERWELVSCIASPDGSQVLRRRTGGDGMDAAEALARVEQLADEMLAAGGREIIEGCRR